MSISDFHKISFRYFEDHLMMKLILGTIVGPIEKDPLCSQKIEFTIQNKTLGEHSSKYGTK
jgi:hypothetical protein